MWCNRIEGQFVVAADTVTVLTGQATQRQCPPERAAGDEQLLAALAQVTNWRRRGDTLELIGAAHAALQGADQLRRRAAAGVLGCARMSITRRDFLNGVALTVAAGLTPAAQLAAQPARYPPALMGLRGQHEGSFETAHAFAREGRRFDFAGLPVEERYDLVVVGGGLSGLSAAWFYRRKIRRRASSFSTITTISAATPSATSSRIGERRIIGYGGSQSFQSPNSFFGPAAKDLLRELGVDIKRFETAFDRDLYPSLGLSRGVFFARETFGRDVLVAGRRAAHERRRDGAPAEQRQAARRVRGGLSDLGGEQGAISRALFSASAIRSPAAAGEEKLALLKRTSYRDYLIKICGCSEEVANVLQGRTLGFFGLGADAVPAEDVRDLGYPGFAGLGLGGGQRGLERALHLSFPGRQRVAGAAAGALADPRRRAGQHHGRRGAGAVRLRQARRSRAARPHPARRDLPRCPQRRRRGADRLQPRRRDAPRRGASTRCWPASTWSSRTSCRSCRRRSARRWRRTSRRRSSTPT